MQGGCDRMSELPYWIQSIQALGPTVVAIIAALIAGYIAWRQWRTAHRQWRTAHDQLSFDLYEKRFAVYEATQSFLTTAIVVGRITEEDCKALFKVSVVLNFSLMVRRKTI